MMILKMDTELGSEVKLTPPDGVQSFHVQHLPHPHSSISDRFIVTSDQWHSEATLRDINRQTRQQNLNILRGFHRDIKICYQRQRDHSKMNVIPLRNAAKVRDIPHIGNSGKFIAWLCFLVYKFRMSILNLEIACWEMLIRSFFSQAF